MWNVRLTRPYHALKERFPSVLFAQDPSELERDLNAYSLMFHLDPFRLLVNLLLLLLELRSIAASILECVLVDTPLKSGPEVHNIVVGFSDAHAVARFGASVPRAVCDVVDEVTQDVVGSDC